MSGSEKQNSDLASALYQAHEDYVRRHPESRRIHERAVRSMPGGNTRSVLHYSPFPIAMKQGEECSLIDVDNNRYLNLCGEYTAGLFGHSEKRIHEAIHNAMAHGISLAAVGQGEAELAEIVCSRFPSVERVRFTNSGTEANLMALTAARCFTGREMVVAFRGGYHGGVLLFPLAGPSPVTVPFPFLMADYNDEVGAVNLIAANAHRIAAVIVEPMLGSAGCIPSKPAFLQALRDITKTTETILIFDEVMTSRMSAGGVQERFGIVPDMTTLGKYLAGGMSVGAFGGRTEIMALFENRLPHAGTFNNNVLSIAAGKVALSTIFTRQIAEDFFEQGEAFRGLLNNMLQRTGVPMHFSGMGSLMTVQFRPPEIIRPHLSDTRENDLRELFFFDMLAAGIYIARRGMIALSLPIKKQDLNYFLNAVEEFVESRMPLLSQGEKSS